MLLAYSIELYTFMSAKWYRLLVKGNERGYWNVSLFGWSHYYEFMTHDLLAWHTPDLFQVVTVTIYWICASITLAVYT